MNILISKTSLLLSAVLVALSLPSSLCKPCRDDPVYTFGRYTWVNDANDEVETERSCAWLTKNPNKVQQRKNEWCDPLVSWRFGVKIFDKCAVTCGKCDGNDEENNGNNEVSIVETPPKKCRDDPIYTFGRYTWVNDANDEVETERSCAWLTKNPNKVQQRKKEWCDPAIEWRFGVKIFDKCAVTCDKCTNDQDKNNNVEGIAKGLGVNQCRDMEEWFDQGGPLFGCKWYAELPERCADYGYRFRNNGKVANEACCACGGGRRD